MLSMSTSAVRVEASSDDAARAESLFHEGVALFEAGQVAPACRKLEESQKLDPAPGTLFNLAICHHAEGRTVVAYDEFVTSLDVAIKAKRSDREATCRAHLAELDKVVTRVIVVVRDAARVPGLTVKWDGEIVDEARFNAEIPRDSGTHILRAEAPGRQAWGKTLTIAGGGKKLIEVPPLDPLVVGNGDASPMPIATSSTAVKGTPTSAYLFGIGGLVLIGGGIVARVLAVGAKDDREEHCHTTFVGADCTTAADDYGVAKIRRLEAISWTSLGVGVASLATGIIIFASSRSSSGVTMGMVPRGDGGLLSVGGAF